MKQPRSDSYEAQLTPEQRDKLHYDLLEPGANLAQIQAALPPWRSGQFAGSLPTLRTLSSIAARLRLDSFLTDISANVDALAAINTKTASHPASSGHPTPLMDNICNLIEHEVLDKTIKRQSARERAALVRLLLRHEEINLQRLKYQRLTVAQIEDWYWMGPGKEIMEAAKTDRECDRLETMGKLLYGKLWDSPSETGLLSPAKTKKHPQSASTPSGRSAVSSPAAKHTGPDTRVLPDSKSSTAPIQGETSPKAPAKG